MDSTEACLLRECTCACAFMVNVHTVPSFVCVNFTYACAHVSQIESPLDMMFNLCRSSIKCRAAILCETFIVGIVCWSVDSWVRGGRGDKALLASLMTGNRVSSNY